MPKELKFGEYAIMGDKKEKRIYIGAKNGKYYAVDSTYEQEYIDDEHFLVVMYDSAEPIQDESVYYYQWEKTTSEGVIVQSPFITDGHAVKNIYVKNGWKRNDSTKRTAL